MRTLLVVSAFTEAGTGLLLVALPSVVVTLLLGSRDDTAVALTVARTAGVALLALAVACWRARHDAPGRAARAVVGAMAMYNAGIFAVLVHAGTGLGLSAMLLWPVVLVHAAMAVWCVAALRNAPATATGPTRG